MNKPKTYKQLEQELRKVLKRVENESYDVIHELLKYYKKGMTLASQLEEKLKTARNTIVKVKASN